MLKKYATLPKKKQVIRTTTFILRCPLPLTSTVIKTVIVKSSDTFLYQFMIRSGEKSNNIGGGKINSGEENGNLTFFLIIRNNYSSNIESITVLQTHKAAVQQFEKKLPHPGSAHPVPSPQIYLSASRGVILSIIFLVASWLRMPWFSYWGSIPFLYMATFTSLTRTS